MLTMSARSQPTYEGLKPDRRKARRALARGSQPTYEGLKPGPVYPYTLLTLSGSQPTYEGLKLFARQRLAWFDQAFPAYL